MMNIVSTLLHLWFWLTIPLMTRVYQSKFLPDGSPNPKFKPDKRVGSRRKKTVRSDQLAEKRKSNGNSHKRVFVAIDGEGVTIKTPDGDIHNYVLMRASPGEVLVRRDRFHLTTTQCFEFLLDLADRYPGAIFCVYGANYDINQWLADVPKDKLTELWGLRDAVDNHNKLVRAGSRANQRIYEFSWRPGKKFILKRVAQPAWTKKVTKHRKDSKDGKHKAGETSQKWERLYDRSIVIYDVSSFFGGKFVDVLETWFADLYNDKTGLITFSDGQTVNLARMQIMKKKRKTFSLDELDSEMEYCAEEVLALQKLMERLDEYLTRAELEVHEWDGGGAVAAALLRQNKVKDHLKEKIPNGRLYDAMLRAYSAGRIELGMFGVYIGKIFNDDINSAHPSHMLPLPSLTDGMWRRIKGLSKRPYSLMHVRWRFDDRLMYYPFFIRDESGTIYYPPVGENWVWKPEVDVALKALAQGKLDTKWRKGEIEVLESWEFGPASDVKPFAFVAEKFKLRQLWKKLGEAAEKVLKVGLNSLYGKLCQSVGGTEESKPPFHNIGMAGYITSGTRAQVFDAIIRDPEAVIMSATDGVFSIRPIEGLDMGDDLGQWSRKQFDGIIAVEPGVYWALKKLGREPTPEERLDEDFPNHFLEYDGVWYQLTPRFRGYDAGTLYPQKVLDGWKNFSEKDNSINVTSTRMVGLGSALASHKLWPHWRTFLEVDRKLNLVPEGKRLYASNVDPRLAQRQLIPTEAAITQEQYRFELSERFKLHWERGEKEYGDLDGVAHEVVEQECADTYDRVSAKRRGERI